MPHQNPKVASDLTKMVIGVMLIQLFLIGYVFYTSYNERKTIVEAQRAGCERGKLDRDANAQGWRQAEEARFNAGEFAVAKTYRDIASSLESRSEITCEEVFPDASLIP